MDRARAFKGPSMACAPASWLLIGRCNYFAVLCCGIQCSALQALTLQIQGPAG